MKRVSFLLIIFLFILACSHNPVWVKFDSIESYAKERPDSARVQLLAMDQELLNTPSLRARYALMLTTANSRCKIKEQDDSLINVAVKYYSKWGPKKEKFLAYYYQGRIYQDSRNYEAAMKSYLNAESIHSKDISDRYWTSLYLKMGYIYLSLYSLDLSLSSFQKATYYAQKSDWLTNEISAILGISGIYLLKDDYKQADSCLQYVSSRIDWKNQSDVQKFLNNKILYLRKTNAPKDSLKKYADLASCLLPAKGALQAAQGYTECGEFDKAKRSLFLFENNNSKFEENPVYLQVKYQLLDSLHDYKEGFHTLEKLINLRGYSEYERFNKDTKFLAERVRFSKTKHSFLFGSIFFGLIILILALLFINNERKRREEKKELETLYMEIKQEYESICSVLHNHEELQDSARKALGDRVSSLAQFLSKEKPQSLSKVADQLEALSENRKELLDTIGLLYAIYYPSVITVLVNHKLTTTEVGYCCLLQLGFRTREVGDVINRSGSYNISSAIRKKLGLGPNDTNLSNYIKGLFESNNT